MIHVIGCGSDRSANVGRWFDCLARQTWGQWRATVALDHFNWSDPDARNIDGLQRAMASGRVEVKTSPAGHGRMANIVRAMDCVAAGDVVLLHDLDDFLVHQDALEIVADAHAGGAWATYGTYVDTNLSASHWCGVIEPETWRHNSHRRAPWRSSAPQSFRRALWDHIPEAHFREPDGQWLRRASDQAIMLAVLELCGRPSRVRYLREILAVVEIHTGPAWEDRIVEHVRSHAPLALLERLEAPACAPR